MTVVNSVKFVSLFCGTWEKVEILPGNGECDACVRVRESAARAPTATAERISIVEREFSRK